MLGEGEWKTKKHGADYRRQWRKVHLGIDAQTMEIRAIEVTSNAIGDAPMLPELLAQIPTDEPIASVCADGAYDTRDCLDAIARRQRNSIKHARRFARRDERRTIDFAGFDFLTVAAICLSRMSTTPGARGHTSSSSASANCAFS